jgi:hypothetical protein
MVGEVANHNPWMASLLAPSWLTSHYAKGLMSLLHFHVVLLLASAYSYHRDPSNFL